MSSNSTCTFQPINNSLSNSKLIGAADVDEDGADGDEDGIDGDEDGADGDEDAIEKETTTRGGK